MFSVMLAAAAAIHLALGPEQFRLIEPFGVDFDRGGNWYVVEHKGQRIVRVNRDGKVEVIAGTGQVGNSGDGGPAHQATFFDPHGIAITRDGKTMYVADTRNHQIRRIELGTGVISKVAGSGQEGFSGDGGPAPAATFKGTFGIALGHDERALFVADLGNKRVRRIDLKSGIVTTVAGNGTNAAPADGSAAAQSPLQDPRAVAVDSKGNLYILERQGNALRVVDRGGIVRTLIAPGSIQPDLKGPKHLCIDRSDRVVIADAENHLIRRYDPKSGKTVTIAGTGAKGTRIEESDPLRTELARPHGVFVNRGGELYIVDSYNHRVLRMTAK